ncbi:MAG: Hercynine oxygenase [bacterium]|nr:Hercynine oxygenase [bacterium]
MAPTGSGLRMNSHYIAGPTEGQNRPSWLKELRGFRDRARSGLDIHDREDLAWVADTRACGFAFIYDSAVYDRASGEYRLDRFLDEGEREFGGYDIVVLWQAYPRIGIDERNQFDFYRDMPGGLDAVREQVRLAHSRGVKVALAYNPWDTGTRREPLSDEESLADLVATIEADGIFLDTLSGTGGALREAVDRQRPGVALIPEIVPPLAQLGLCSASWAQWFVDPYPPGILLHKWIEPRHPQYQIRRWDESHAAEIESAFFNGSGMMVWENIFGSYNPWRAEDRLLWKNCSEILKRFPEHFRSKEWEPFIPTLQSELHANAWRSANSTLITLLNLGKPLRETPLLELETRPGMAYFDLWNGARIREENSGKRIRLPASIDRLGSFLAVPVEEIDESLLAFVEKRRESPKKVQGPDPRNFSHPVVEPKPAPRSKPAQINSPPPGMVLAPGGSFRMKLHHMRRECGTYPDPGSPKENWKKFLWGSPHDEILERDFGTLEVQSFFIDEAEVSNAEYKRFLDGSGYRPKVETNFLKHWKEGQIPPGEEDFPVVYVDLEDARAYSRWAGKRLPTEIEWQYAAQGTDGREWPWGGEFDPTKCNTTGRPMPVRSLPEGRGPFGCHHLSGNVWEWIESERDDGHTAFAILRGGSYYRAEGSIWYTPGGPLPVNTHAKFLLMAPSLDRCSTVGFRCVAEVGE